MPKFRISNIHMAKFQIAIPKLGSPVCQDPLQDIYPDNQNQGISRF